MGIRYLKKHAALEDIVTVEDAETLFEWLKKHPKPAVNLSKCRHLHSAALQVLMIVKPTLIGTVPDAWLAHALQA